MIEKLKTINPYDETEIDMDTNSVGGMVYENTPLIQKVNQLVDTVNAILSRTYTVPIEDIANVPQENKFDPYAEQRKWIGKVCWFWDNDNTNSSCGILTSIDTETFKEPQFVCNDEYDYEHCEPVKPDDDIIYKGGDND